MSMCVINSYGPGEMFSWQSQELPGQQTAAVSNSDVGGSLRMGCNRAGRGRTLQAGRDSGSGEADLNSRSRVLKESREDQESW